MPMPDDTPRITVRHADRNLGPYTLDEVNRLLHEGRLSRNDLAWVEGAPEWTRLGYVPGTIGAPPPLGLGGEPASPRLVLPAFLLAFFVGAFGVHRFYVGKTGSGIAMLVLTLTLIGSIVSIVWATIDWILIVCGVFRDAEGRRLMQWT
ncbi:MAG: NINE protein [Planctomycetes bacterium]|nr:NINE protein [Planctomycetota bacterium]